MKRMGRPSPGDKQGQASLICPAHHPPFARRGAANALNKSVWPRAKLWQFDTHGLTDLYEVLSRNLEVSELERCTPALLVLDERKSGYEWPNRGFGAGHELDVHSVWLEVWRHLDLVDLASDDTTDCREGLKRFTVWIGGLGRVDRDVVAFLGTLTDGWSR